MNVVLVLYAFDVQEGDILLQRVKWHKHFFGINAFFYLITYYFEGHGNRQQCVHREMRNNVISSFA